MDNISKRNLEIYEFSVIRDKNLKTKTSDFFLENLKNDYNKNMKIFF